MLWVILDLWVIKIYFKSDICRKGKNEMTRNDEIIWSEMDQPIRNQDREIRQKWNRQKTRKRDIPRYSGSLKIEQIENEYNKRQHCQ